MLAGYFSRVMGSLLLRRTQDIMQYLQRHQELLLQASSILACAVPARPSCQLLKSGFSWLGTTLAPTSRHLTASICSFLLPSLQLVEHVDTTSIAEVLVRLVGADEQRAYLSTNHLQWLSGKGSQLELRGGRKLEFSWRVSAPGHEMRVWRMRLSCSPPVQTPTCSTSCWTSFNRGSQSRRRATPQKSWQRWRRARCRRSHATWPSLSSLSCLWGALCGPWPLPQQQQPWYRRTCMLQQEMVARSHQQRQSRPAATQAVGLVQLLAAAQSRATPTPLKMRWRARLLSRWLVWKQHRQLLRAASLMLAGLPAPWAAAQAAAP